VYEAARKARKGDTLGRERLRSNSEKRNSVLRSSPAAGLLPSEDKLASLAGSAAGLADTKQLALELKGRKLRA
jgi:hypothetical protein